MANETARRKIDRVRGPKRLVFREVSFEEMKRLIRTDRTCLVNQNENAVSACVVACFQNT